jgi:hypothetical protein
MACIALSESICDAHGTGDSRRSPRGRRTNQAPRRPRPRELAEMTDRRTPNGPSSTSAIGATLGATDRHEPCHFPWPLESTHQPCPPQTPAGIDQEEGPGMRKSRYHRVSLAAATSQLHVELEGSHGKLSGIDLRGHNRSHGAPRHRAADAGATRVAGLWPASASSARRPASYLGAGRRNPQLPCSVITTGRHRFVCGAAYPLGRHLVVHNSGGRC